MKMLTPSQLELITHVLFSDNPSLPRFQTQFEKELSISPEDATTLLYQVVFQLNSRLFPRITHLELILTEQCNLACSYCFENGMIRSRKMASSVAQAAIDILFDYAQDEPVVHITLFGGEPTINFSGI